MRTMSNNLFLDSLSPGSRHTLINLSTAVSLPLGTVLYEPDVIPQYAYLLTSGIASTITKTKNGDSAEVGLVGHEGVVGSLQLLGPAPVPAESMIQVDASALRLSLREFRKVFLESEEIRNSSSDFLAVTWEGACGGSGNPGFVCHLCDNWLGGRSIAEPHIELIELL